MSFDCSHSLGQPNGTGGINRAPETTMGDCCSRIGGNRRSGSRETKQRRDQRSYATILLALSVCCLLVPSTGFGIGSCFVPTATCAATRSTTSFKMASTSGVSLGRSWDDCRCRKQANLIVVAMTKIEEVEEDDEYVEVLSSANSNNNNTSDFGEEDLSGAGFVIEDLNWRVEKMRLEEANKRRFLKAKPRFLPYEDAQNWVQAWGTRWKTAKDWSDWIAMGEKRNSYIPSWPDEYYGRLGQWISWEHFLGVPETNEFE